MAGAESNLCQSDDVLRGLLHFVSQPLTSLHCALEGALAREETKGADDVRLALEQTDRVIEAVRLMREYLEAEQGCSSPAPAPLSSALDKVLEQLAVLAEARRVSLFACGVSKGVIAVRNAWLERALLYLIGALIESEPPGRAITVLIEDGALQSVISGHSFQPSQNAQSPQLAQSPHRAKSGRYEDLEGAPVGDAGPAKSALGYPPRCTSESSVLRRAKRAIAQCALESSGASVEFYSADKPGFTIRIPQSASVLNQLSA